MDKIFYALLLVVLGFIFVGSQWQMEISILNTVHGWEFGYFFCLVTLNNWVARDIFYTIQFAVFLLAITTAYFFGKTGGDNDRQKPMAQ